MFRLSVDATEDFATLVPQMMSKISADDVTLVSISDAPPGQGGLVRLLESLQGQTIEQLGLQNGAMLYVEYERIVKAMSELTTDANKEETASSVTVAPNAAALEPTKQLAIDDELDREDGLIERPRSYMCRHGDKGMCEYCSPLPPWDKEYQKEKKYKHLSFHAYVKELNEQKNNKFNATSYMAPLEEPNYNSRILANGRREGPAVITLQQQKFRMVDHVEMSDSAIMNQFIDVWRQTGVQRFGYMYGRYERYSEVPLGIKAVVEAIYEPPQQGEVDGITLLEWQDENIVERVATALGLQRVGIIFTDLTDLGLRNGTVLCKRHKDTYFLSCLEIMMAARYQVRHPNVTRHSSSGYFLSKFVTCVILGGLKGEIEPQSFQVSVDAEALIKADIILATTQPSMLHVNDNNGKRYVPDIYYLKINEYGLEVKTNAKPTFPVEFLLVSLSSAFPKEPQPQFQSHFTIENRDFMGELQDLKAAYKLVTSLNDSGDGMLMVDFHFLVYLLKMDILGKEEQQLLLQFARHGGYEDYLKVVGSPGWMTLVTILEHSL
jgi:nuclear protein localization family protein 4